MPQLRPFLLSAAAVLLACAALLAPAATPGQAPVPGTDYEPIEDGAPWQPLDGKVEVVEVFAYWCPHCAEFEPAVKTWRSKLPKDVRFTYLPGVFDPNDAFAYAWFAARALGVAERNHDALFQAIHTERTLPRNATMDELAQWFAGRGVDEAKFRAAMASPAVAAQVRRAREFAVRSQVGGTPTIIVNGKFQVLGGSREQLLRNTDALIAMQRARR